MTHTCILRLTAMAILIPLVTNTGFAQTNFVFADSKHDAKGNLLPLQSYGETISRGMKFLLEDQDAWAKGNKITDEEGRIRPPYFFYCHAIEGRLDGMGHPRNRNTAYPAFHHAIYIQTFLDYYVYSGKEEGLKRAEELARWNMAHSTPLDWMYGGMPYSSVCNGKVGGSVDGDAIMTDKPAIMASAYLRLFRMTGKPEYRKAAEQIASTLARNQSPEGNWPFRVNPKTGEVSEEYTSSVIYAIELFEELDELTGQKQYASAKDKALQWLLAGPVQNMIWNGFYEDVTKAMGLNNRTNWDCIDTARYLLRHKGENPDYLPLALKLTDWVKKTFVDEKHTYIPAEAVREQLACNSRMGVHSGHWAMLGGDLYHSTGKEIYKTNAFGTLNYITYLLQPDNSILVGREWTDKAIWYSCHSGSVRFLMHVLGYFPEAAPDGENHLLRASAAVKTIQYEPDKVSYGTDGSSSDVLKLAFQPKAVTVNGTPLDPSTKDKNGWDYDPKTKVLRLSHEAGNVVIN